MYVSLSLSIYIYIYIFSLSLSMYIYIYIERDINLCARVAGEWLPMTARQRDGLPEDAQAARASPQCPTERHLVSHHTASCAVVWHVACYSMVNGAQRMHKL